MRKEKVGAIQPDYLYPPPVYDCMTDQFVNDAAEIIENYIIKRWL